jgi:hypothetical protein
MKRAVILVFICFIFFNCKKNKIIDQPLSEHYPQSWVFTIDKSADEYIYIYTNGGGNMFRDNVQKSYSLVQMAEDVDCKFFLNLARAENGDQCVTIQRENDKRYWVFGGTSTNRQEMHVGISNKGSETNAPDDDQYKFKIHKLEDVGGVKTIAIESIAHPGYFISSSPPGFNYAATQLTLQSEPGAAHATAWQCR